MMSTWQEWLFAKAHSKLESEQAYATRTVFSRMLPIPLVYIDLGIHFTLLLFATLPFHSTTSVFHAFANNVFSGKIFIAMDANNTC